MNSQDNHDIERNQNFLAVLSIRRPVFITCVVVLIMVVGYLSSKNISVNLFPNISIPVVYIQTIYPGAGPKEIEANISKIIEEEVASIVGMKALRSVSREGVSTVICEFYLSTDVKYAEQQVRDRLSIIRSKIPKDAKDPIVRRLDPADLPVASVSLVSSLPTGKAFDLANDIVKVNLEQGKGVGLVEIFGSRKREIKVSLDREKLKTREVSAGQIVARLAQSGSNVPIGKMNISSSKENIFRTSGEYSSIKEIGDTVISFFGNDIPVTVKDVAVIEDSLVDESTRTYVNGKQSIVLNVFKQSGSNTISVVEDVIKKLEKVNKLFKEQGYDAQLKLVRDGAKEIRANVTDVKESIFLGIILTILVVFLFLGNMRSTIITGLALPNSLLGAFILIVLAGFSINVMTLLALSLSVGLLIDDAIVVRENIFRHIEMGKDPKHASLIGTTEVTMAVLATTLTVMAVFGPIAFLDGIVGQFFKEFGLTICFVMLISTFDALTIAPMLSTYFAGKGLQNKHISKTGYEKKESKWFALLIKNYHRMLHFSMNRPVLVLVLALFIFIASIISLKWVPKTFLPPQDVGEFTIALEMQPGTNLEEMDRISKKIDEEIRKYKEVKTSLLIVGQNDGEANRASFYVNLVPAKERKINTIEFKNLLRKDLEKYKMANPLVKDFDPIGGGDRPFSLTIIGDNDEELERISKLFYEKIKNHPSITDVDISIRSGRPETQIVPLRKETENYGVSISQMGMELRILMEGQNAAIFREKGNDYDIKVRLAEDQRDVVKNFEKTFVPNINYSLIPLSSVATVKESTSNSNILRQDRAHYVFIGAEIAPNGPGTGGAIAETERIFREEIPLPKGMRYAFIGQAENFTELIANMAKAALLAILFIYLVLASLYESFVIPLTIMLVLPLAICGAFFALLITQHSLDLFSMIGCIMLLGVATKNSIILVDYANQLVKQGVELREAIDQACKKRIRPILMTSFALIAGMLPIAYGLNEASKQRMSMGIAVIGGVVSSTFLTLVVVPAAYCYIERFRRWSLAKILNLVK